jgi:hypothetical protein
MTKEEQAQAQADLAACYARVFLGDEDGKRVLVSLRAKFKAPFSFHLRNGQRYDALDAAIIDGQRQVMDDIEAALKLAAPNAWAASHI